MPRMGMHFAGSVSERKGHEAHPATIRSKAPRSEVHRPRLQLVLEEAVFFKQGVRPAQVNVPSANDDPDALSGGGDSPL